MYFPFMEKIQPIFRRMDTLSLVPRRLHILSFYHQKNPLITQGSHKSTAPGIVTIIDIEGHDENEAS